jgi:hypothetical protein
VGRSVGRFDCRQNYEKNFKNERKKQNIGGNKEKLEESKLSNLFSVLTDSENELKIEI